MSWPLPQDFNEAVQNPATAFSDPDLKTAQPVVGPTGLPLPRSGNFADVYQVRAADGRNWAVKCFTRPVTGLEDRYAKVDAALTKAGLPFTVGFAFQAEGVRVRGAWYPLVKMDWVDGLLLNQVARDQAGKPAVLDALGQMWAKLCKRLREAGVAHADLQHGNVLLVPGARPGAYGLKLIDYDGMYVPALANSPSGEAGHPNFQHPQRAAKRVYSPDVDRFPHLVIATALKGLAVLGPKLWEKYDTGDNLLFTEDDFRAPAASNVMKELWEANNPGLRALVGQLAIACGKPVPQTPWLDVIAPDGVAAPLSADQLRAASAALGLAVPVAIAATPAVHVVTPADEMDFGVVPGAPAAPPPVPVAPLPAPAFDLPSFEVDDEVEPRRKRPEPAKGFPVLPVTIAAGVLVLVGGIVGGVLMFGDKKPPVETVQHDPDDKKDDGKPPPKAKDVPKVADPPVVPRPPENEPTAPAGIDNFPFLNVDTAGVPTLRPRWQTAATATPATVRFTADGKWVVAREAGATGLRVFAARTGSEVVGFQGDGSPTVDFACLADGHFASLHADQPFALVWNPGTGKRVGKIPVGVVPAGGRGPKIFDASPDGRYVVVGFGAPAGAKADPGGTGRVAVYDAEANREVLNLEVRGPKFRFLTGGELVVADLDDVRRFRLPAGTARGEVRIEGDHRASKILACSADGALVLHPGMGRDLRVYDGATGKQLALLPRRFMGNINSAAAFSDDRRYLAVCSQTEVKAGASYLEVVDLTTGRLVGRATLNPFAAPDVPSVAFAPDNSAVVVGRTARQVQVFDLPAGSAVAVVPKPRDPDPVPPVPVEDPPPVTDALALKPRWVAATPRNQGFLTTFFDGPTQTVLLHDSYSATVTVVDARTGAVKPGAMPIPPQTAKSVISPMAGGKIGFRSGQERVAAVWDIATGKSVAEVPIPDLPADPTGTYEWVQVSPDGRYTVGYRMGGLKRVEGCPFRLYDAAARKTVLSFDWAGGSAHFTADSSRVLVAELGGRFRWFKLPSGDVDAVWDLGKPPLGREHKVTSVSGDGRRIGYNGPHKSGPDALAQFVLDGTTGDPVRRFGADYSYAGDVAVSDDGRRAAVLRAIAPVGSDFVMDVVEVATGAVVGRATVTTTNRSVPRMLLAPGGKSLVVEDNSSQKLYRFDLPGADVAVVPPKPKDPVLPPVRPGEARVRWTAPFEGAPAIGVAVGFSADEAAVGVVLGKDAGVASFATRTGAALPDAFPRGVPTTGVTRFDGGRFGTYSPRERAVLMWDPQKGEATGKVPVPDPKPGSRPDTVVLSPNERYLVVGYAPTARPVAAPTDPPVVLPNDLLVYDTTTGKAVVSTEWYAKSVHFTADSARVLVVERTGRCRWFKLPGGTPDGEFKPWDAAPMYDSNTYMIFGVSADGSRVVYSGPLAAGGGTDTGLFLLDGKTGRSVRKIADTRPTTVTITPDARVLARAMFHPRDGSWVEVFDATRSTLLASVKLGPAAGQTALALTADGRSLAVYNTAPGQLTVYDLPGGPVAVAPKVKDPDPVIPPKPKDPPPPVPPKPVERVPVPDAAAVVAATAAVRDALKDDFKKSSPADRKALAVKLIGRADKAADPADKYAALVLARDLAAEAAEPAVAILAVEAVVAGFAVEADKVRVAAVEKLRDAVGNATAMRVVVDYALSAADDEAAADDHVTALRLAQLAAAAAQRVGLPAASLDEIAAHVEATRQLAVAFSPVKAALDRLKADPADADANRTVGKYRSFVQGRWDEGVKLLARGGFGDLPAAADLDAKTPRDGVPDVKAADAWWDFAQTAPGAERRAAQARARYWYTRALPGLTGADKARADDRLALAGDKAEYRPGLVAEFTAKFPAVLKGKKWRLDPVVDFSGGEFADTGAGRATDLTVRWSGAVVAPRPGRYRIAAATTDPVRVKVDGKTVIDTISTKVGKREAFVTLADRPAPVAIELQCVNTDLHSFKLVWAAPGAGVEVPVPPESLYHDRKTEPPAGK